MKRARRGELYFAYGSNMRRTRMLERVPSAESLGAAMLAGHGLRLNKRGRDGSAKANLVVATSEHVWGVLYRIQPGDWHALDRVEGGYERHAVTLDLSGSEHEATTYRSNRLLEGHLAFDWYLAHLRDGAREHALPAPWLELLDALRGLPGTEDC